MEVESVSSYNGNPEEVRKILSEDWIYRKKCQWPLIELSSFGNIHRSIPKTVNPKDLLFIKHNTFKKTITDFNNVFDRINMLYGLYPALPILFEKYKGKIAVCGGVLTRILTQDITRFHSSDCDIFFYNMTQSEADVVIMDCIATMATLDGRQTQNYKNNPHKRNNDASQLPEFETRVDRHDNFINVTHIYKYRITDQNAYRPEREQLIKYQFILRIYPTLDSIIGGFDIGACMLAFDGTNIYGTPLSAWTIAKKAIIVDTTRRSTSFEHRLLKYSLMEFDVVFPGLDDISKYEMNKKEKHAKVAALKKFMFDNGMVLSDAHDQDGRPFEDYIGVKPPHVKLGKGLKLLLLMYDNSYSLEIEKKWLRSFDRKLPEVMTEEILKRYSDYHDYINFHEKDQGLSDIYGTMLRCNNRASLFVSGKMPNDYDKALELFRTMIYEPQIIIDIDRYHEIYQRRLMTCCLDDDRNNYISILGEYYPELERIEELIISSVQKTSQNWSNKQARIEAIRLIKCEPSHPIVVPYIDFYKKVFNIMTTRIINNKIKWERDFSGLKWRIDNPGTQWTSSINPIMENPREFYYDNYKRFWIGIPEEIETILRLMWKNCYPWNIINCDCFNTIMQFAILAWYR